MIFSIANEHACELSLDLLILVALVKPVAGKLDCELSGGRNGQITRGIFNPRQAQTNKTWMETLFVPPVNLGIRTKVSQLCSLLPCPANLLHC